ncbi:MAG: hypothetical protein H6807_08205 [Planctomycetes bacterium]|nr:hypothetical protein [Planctomycetota bacterium]
MHRVPKCFALVFLSLLALLVTAPGLSAQNQKQAFLAAFRGAVDSGDFSKQRSLVGQNKDLSFGAFFDFEADMLKARVADNLEAANKAYSYMEAMASNFRLEFNEAYLNDRQRWANGLEGEAAQKRIDAYNSYWNGVQSQSEGDGGNEQGYLNALESYSNSLLACFEIKDYFWAAMAANYMSGIHNKLNNYFESAYYARWCKDLAVRGGIAGRSDFAWIDGYLNDLHDKKRVLRPDLIDITINDMDKAKAAHAEAVVKSQQIESVPGEDDDPRKRREEKPGLAAPAPGKGIDTETWSEWNFKPGIEKDAWTKIKLPYYNARWVSPTNPQKDPFYQYEVFDKDAAAKDFGAFPGGKAEYDGSLNLTTDLQKKPKLKVKSNKFAKVELKVRYDDDSEAEVAHMMLDYLPTRKKLFGQDFRFQDEDKSFLVAWYGISAVRGKVHGEDIEIVDTNGNGVFRDTGEDSVIIGKGKTARIEPLGRYIFLPGENGLYPFEFKVNDKLAKLVRTRPFKGALAPITVEYSTGSGKMPEYLIARGTGEDVEFYFDLMKGLDPAKPIWVPEGRYEIFQGYFLFGSGNKETNLLIGKGTSKAFEVKPGQLNVWKLGGTGEYGFRMLGDVTRSAESKTDLVCDGKNIRVIGNWGEQYFNFYVERITPTISIRRDSENGRKVGGEDMKLLAGDGVQMVDLWYPAPCTIKNVPSGADLFYQFTAKHGILGQIKSDWYKVN